MGVGILKNAGCGVKGHLGPRDVLVDDIDIPPRRTMTILVRNADGEHEFCDATIIELDHKLVCLINAPRDGVYATGDYIYYDWMPGCGFAILKSGRGQF